MAAERPESYFRVFWSSVVWCFFSQVQLWWSSTSSSWLSTTLLHLQPAVERWMGIFCTNCRCFLAGSYLVKLCINVDGGIPNGTFNFFNLFYFFYCNHTWDKTKNCKLRMVLLWLVLLKKKKYILQTDIINSNERSTIFTVQQEFLHWSYFKGTIVMKFVYFNCSKILCVWCDIFKWVVWIMLESLPSFTSHSA